MRHVVLGAGNLGLDLAYELNLRGHETILISRSRSDLEGRFLSVIDGRASAGVSGPSLGVTESDIAGLKPDVVWNTLGAGGPTNRWEDWVDQMDLHFKFPLRLMAAIGNTSRLVLFSTHYLNGDHTGRYSFYARSKLAMEAACKEAAIIRVGSLYGDHKPLSCLPGKLTQAVMMGKAHFSGVGNQISPTPTAWLAQELVCEEVWLADSILNVGPRWGVPIFSWMGLILEEIQKQTGVAIDPVVADGFDLLYPPESTGFLYTDQAEWRELWAIYGPLTIRSALEKISVQNHCHQSPRLAQG